MEKSNTIRNLLIIICIGIWILILQNFGIIPRRDSLRVDAKTPIAVHGTVEVENTVFVKGSVDANLESINGQHNVFYKDPKTGNYYVIPTTDPYE